MLIKSFITGKRGEGFDSIEDSIAIDISAGRFAVSDGVSKSFFPHVWSNILVKSWLSIDDVGLYPPVNLCECFNIERSRIMEMVDETTRMDFEDMEELYHTASATFCGVQLRDGILKWVVLGDTCLFLMLPGEQLRCISSRPMPTDEFGHITPSFDNLPNQILADGRVYGEWIRGEIPFEKGTVLLMSDAMSAWFINAHNDDKDPLSQLLALSDDHAFEQWVDEQVNLGLLASDDESVVIIQLEDTSQCNQETESEHITTTLEKQNATCEVPYNSIVQEGISNPKIDKVESKNTHCFKLRKSKIDAILRLCKIKYKSNRGRKNGAKL
jgi:hypothetical protein